MQNTSTAIAKPKDSLNQLESKITDIAMKASADVISEFYQPKKDEKPIVPCRECGRDLGIRRKYRNGDLCGMGCWYREWWRKELGWK